MQRYIAITTIGPSTLRNQGSKGVIKAAQQYLSKINLRKFTTKDEISFLKNLDYETERLRKSLPVESQNWGAARKALNLFLRDICYNKFLSSKYKLSNSENWMEIPLDSFVSNSLKRHVKRGQLPLWPGLNKLTSEISFKFQCVAKKVAKSQNISRIHLDMQLWVKERDKIGESTHQASGTLHNGSSHGCVNREPTLSVYNGQC